MKTIETIKFKSYKCNQIESDDVYEFPLQKFKDTFSPEIQKVIEYMYDNEDFVSQPLDEDEFEWTQPTIEHILECWNTPLFALRGDYCVRWQLIEIIYDNGTSKKFQ